MLLPGRTNRAVKNLFVGNLKWGARLPEIKNRWVLRASESALSASAHDQVDAFAIDLLQQRTLAGTCLLPGRVQLMLAGTLISPTRLTALTYYWQPCYCRLNLQHHKQVHVVL
jgi:hypothetical protein